MLIRGGKLGRIGQMPLMWPVVKALQALGGSAGNSAIYEKIVELEKFSDDEIDMPHRNTTKLKHQLGWAKKRLKNVGLVNNQIRGTWVLTEDGKHADESDIEDLKPFSGEKDWYLKR